LNNDNEASVALKKTAKPNAASKTYKSTKNTAASLGQKDDETQASNRKSFVR
jgi:hypothetical protein